MPTKYNLNRKNISMLTKDYVKLEALKDEMKLKSLTDTISIMVDAMQQVQLEKKFTCKNCGNVIELPQDSDPKKMGLIHKHLGDPKCLGCIETSYQVKISKEERQRLLELATEHIKKTEAQRHKTDANDKNSEQTEQKTKTQDEIENEETLEEKYARLEENTREFERQKEFERQRKLELEEIRNTLDS